jgi:hypothetical protein
MPEELTQLMNSVNETGSSSVHTSFPMPILSDHSG